MMEVLNVVAIIVAGLMGGSELAIAAFVQPTLDKLANDVHSSRLRMPTSLCREFRQDVNDQSNHRLRSAVPRCDYNCDPN